MRYSQKKAMLVLFILVSSTIISLPTIQYSSANPISIVNMSHGVLLPTNVVHGIIMQRADVFLNISADNTLHATIDYTGNYSFYSTNDTQQELVIAAPFTNDLSGENISMFVNNIKTNYSFGEITIETAENFNYYFPDRYSIYLLICNVTFDPNAITNIYFRYDSFYTTIGYYETFIEYIVGTANSWENSSNIYERVEFRVTGFQPKEYSHDCTVSNIPDGKSYLWEWENEQITVDSVWIKYQFQSIGYRLLVIFLAVFIPIVLMVTIVIIIIKVKKRKGHIP